MDSVMEYSKGFKAFVKEIEMKKWDIYGAQLYVDGVLTDSYGNTETRYAIYSATKAVTSIAVGLAVDEGKLDIRKPILQYIPHKYVDAMTEKQLADYERITTRDLLTMSVSGYPFRATGENWLREALACPVAKKGRFDYSNVSAYLAGVVATEALGEDLGEYLERKLFQPLGIIDPEYVRSPEGYFYGASTMFLSVRELSKIGMVLYNGGTYEGQRILSEAYVKEAASVQKRNREGGYGYFLWKFLDGFSINGKWGQKCYCFPEKRVMISFLGHMEEGSDAVAQSMVKHLEIL